MNVSFTKSTTNHFYPTCPHHLKRFWMVPNPSTLGRIITIRRSPPSSMITLPHSSHRVESCRRRNVMMKIMSHALSLLRHDSLPPSVNTASVLSRQGPRAPKRRHTKLSSFVQPRFNHDATWRGGLRRCDERRSWVTEALFRRSAISFAGGLSSIQFYSRGYYISVLAL